MLAVLWKAGSLPIEAEKLKRAYRRKCHQKLISGNKAGERFETDLIDTSNFVLYHHCSGIYRNVARRFRCLHRHPESVCQPERTLGASTHESRLVRDPVCGIVVNSFPSQLYNFVHSTVHISTTYIELPHPPSEH
ncbi:hypothetical protein TNIN_226991 [Trichonephila inaurata madagascariensis]|uniref:Uncharacterized protein n=1 Tax=Trichonephila inaurata madagascariensis TaxID=2747483 RepID=A0A8X6J3R8_9ARAC|nr:hypothetical protein TNIN_226991 [Trichonephila inaurata madagascariensis]